MRRSWDWTSFSDASRIGVVLSARDESEGGARGSRVGGRSVKGTAKFEHGSESVRSEAISSSSDLYRLGTPGHISGVEVHGAIVETMM